MKTDDSGPAFPGYSARDPQGMTLRQWYAGKALEGWAAGRNRTLDENEPNKVADGCFRYADAMIEAAGDPSRLSIECGRLCREVLEMIPGLGDKPGDEAIMVAWSSLVGQCLSAGAVMPPDSSDNSTVCSGCKRFVYDCTCSKGAAEKPQKDPLLVGLMEALSETQGMEATRGYNHLSMAVEAYVQGRRNAQ